MHRSMTTYVKAISKRKEGDDKEKTLPIAHLGSVMIQHGEDFDSHSEFGRSLACMFRFRFAQTTFPCSSLIVSSDWTGSRKTCSCTGTFSQAISSILLND